MLNHVPAVLPPLERETVDGVRYYKVPDADEFVKLVSITSVTSFWNREKFAKWRKKVGEDKANEITRKATSRGTDTHTLICLLYTSPSPRDVEESRMPSSA